MTWSKSFPVLAENDPSLLTRCESLDTSPDDEELRHGQGCVELHGGWYTSFRCPLMRTSGYVLPRQFWIGIQVVLRQDRLLHITSVDGCLPRLYASSS